MLQLGTFAPDFTLPDEQGAMVTLSSFRGKNPVVLIFYPGDETPVCTAQLCGIRDSYEEYRATGAVVFGINPGIASNHKRFVQRHSFQFQLLVDSDRSVAQKYESVLISFGPFGLINRTVYVIGIDGTIVFAQPGNPSSATILKSIHTSLQPT